MSGRLITTGPLQKASPLVAAFLLVTGCSGPDQVAAPEPTTTTVTTEAPASTESTSEAPPARRVPTQVSSETTHWVGHGFMTDDNIEIVWSEVEGDDVVYQIFRFDGIGFDPSVVELADPIHEGIGTLSWDDDSVETGSFYTYILRVIADNEVLERRWTATLAVTDTTPPLAVSDLRASVTDDGVLLEWSPSEDDVEFGSYAVFRTDVGDEPQYVGGGGDQEVTSFIDDQLPATGEVSYEVLASDFHDNRSTPVAITVSLG